MLEIGASRPLREDELTFRYTRSGGPGGQHVNTSSTRVELLFDVAGSTALTEPERSLAKRRLRTRLDSERRPTQPTRAAREERLDEKRQRGTRKRMRRPPPASED